MKFRLDYPRPAFTTGFLLALLFSIAMNANAAERKVKKPPDNEVKGCYVTYNSVSGGISREPFLKTRDKDFAAEDGEAEIWGYKPWSQSATKDGQHIEVNVAASRFIPLGKAQNVPTGTTRRWVTCPAGFW